MNKAILCGRLTAKPELRYTGSNKPYARFTIAVNRPKVQDKEREVDFINCISWGKQGEVIDKYFDKGSQILINGRIQVTTYNDKDGNKRTGTDIVVEEFDFIGSKNEIKKEEPKEDPFADFGSTVTIDDNILE